MMVRPKIIYLFNFKGTSTATWLYICDQFDLPMIFRRHMRSLLTNHFYRLKCLSFFIFCRRILLSRCLIFLSSEAVPLAVRIVSQGTHTRRPNTLAAYRLAVAVSQCLHSAVKNVNNRATRSKLAYQRMENISEEITDMRYIHCNKR